MTLKPRRDREDRRVLWKVSDVAEAVGQNTHTTRSWLVACGIPIVRLPSVRAKKRDGKTGISRNIYVKKADVLKLIEDLAERAG